MLSKAKSLAATCLSGFTSEVLAVFRVHSAERNTYALLCFVSLIQALALVTGLGSAIKNRTSAIAYIAGYGAGGLAGIWLKLWLKM